MVGVVDMTGVVTIMVVAVGEGDEDTHCDADPITNVCASSARLLGTATEAPP